MPPVLIVSPASVRENWQNEFQRWGCFEPYLIYGAGKAAAIEACRIGRAEVRYLYLDAFIIGFIY